MSYKVYIWAGDTTELLKLSYEPILAPSNSIKRNNKN